LKGKKYVYNNGTMAMINIAQQLLQTELFLSDDGERMGQKGKED
jgi:hypothetical protein